MIKPTVGRKVWYRPSEQDIKGEIMPKMEVIPGEPLDATVIAVWGDSMVNLAVFDIMGKLHSRLSVTLVQEDDDVPAAGRYAQWMPYQVGQAKKEDAANAPKNKEARATSDQSIEQEIQAKGLTAPRITPADIEANIAEEYYFTAADGANATFIEFASGLAVHPSMKRLTFCVLILRNGTKIVGINYGPVSPENFDPEYGRQDARAQAIEQVWPLMGYELRSKLAEANP